MRYFYKSSPEPSELLRFRKEGGPNCTYGAFPAKDVLRRRVLTDQGFLCCYCMRRIDLRKMKIEHYRSQSKHAAEQLDWKNMLGACEGGEGLPQKLQTCDAHRAADDLYVDPQNETHMTRLRYLPDGEILHQEGTDRIQRDLDVTLNLNNDSLKMQRVSALNGFKEAMCKDLGSKKYWSANRLTQKLTNLRDSSRKLPFLGVVEYWLEKKIRKK
ncbi:MAG: TIGR02646 family protein [Deltaproteobacteria bacterium]|nr:TIGR02646 family protein [Deltaproteobacteria bacterium]